MHTVKVVTLGCSKNLVDSERVLKMLSNAGLDAVHEGDGYANIVIINTCGFIGDAKEESVNTILEQVERKKAGRRRAEERTMMRARKGSESVLR